MIADTLEGARSDGSDWWCVKRCVHIPESLRLRSPPPKTTKYRRRSTLAASGASAPAARVARPLLLSPDSALDCLAGDSPPSPAPALAIACPTPDAGTVRYRTRSILVDRTARVRLRRGLCVLRVCSCRQCASGPPVHARGGHELVLIPASRPGRFRVPRAHQDVGVIMPTTSSASPADGDASAPSSPRSTRC